MYIQEEHGVVCIIIHRTVHIEIRYPLPTHTPATVKYMYIVLLTPAQPPVLCTEQQPSLCPWRVSPDLAGSSSSHQLFSPCYLSTIHLPNLHTAVGVGEVVPYVEPKPYISWQCPH